MNAVRWLTIFASLITLSNAFAQDLRRGTVTGLDESSGSITIQERVEGTVGSSAAPGAAKFAVQDGLLFNALRQGDDVKFSAQDIDGVRTITSLRKE
jgi:Cu/Ag efflux protein CusF